MKVAVISCWKYRDAWKPFFCLLNRFWPDCPYEVDLLTDRFEVFTDTKRQTEIGTLQTPNCDLGEFAGQRTIVVHKGSWCEMLAQYAANENEPVMLFQEDFLVNAPVRQDLIERGLEQMKERNAGCVRLYPCPGADSDYGDPCFGEVAELASYKSSCQVGIWNAEYLHQIASYANGSAADFEIAGTAKAWTLPQPVLAWKREVQPQPLSYLCSAIGRGLWSQDAKKLCDQQNIEVDWSLRGFQPC